VSYAFVVSSVLVVDDESAILRTMGINLRARGYGVQLAASGHQALASAERYPPDVVVLDLGLPDMDGIEVIRRLRVRTEVPIIILSARTAESEKVAALDAGGNDYVSKPFGMDELMARVRAALRTQATAEPEAVVETADFSVDLAARRVRRGEGDLHLTSTEWRIVELLARHPGQLVTQRELLDHVWSLKDAKTNYLRVFMVAIRRKLEPDPAHPRYFVTEQGSGIRFVPEGVKPWTVKP
jgi:two-component system, OmpR family, KDP operon response regulator KdpE